MPRTITAFSNPIVKQARDLRDKRHRRASGKFLAEGLRILTEAREMGHLPVTLFYTASSAGHELVHSLSVDVEQAGGEAIQTTPDILAKLSGKDNPQAVVGIFEIFETSLDAIDRHSAPMWLVAERLRDPGNLGTMLRTADAVGAGALILIDECVDPFSVEAVRASMGAVFTVPVVHCAWAEFIAWLQTGPGYLVGLHLNTQTGYRDVSYAAPAFLLTGNEAQGMPDDMAASCVHLVRIPMLGKADSLNAAIATAVLAYEVLAQIRSG